MNIRQGGRRPVDHARPSSSPPSIRAIHTHYDGQATWDEELAPSTPHGVTTVVMVNVLAEHVDDADGADAEAGRQQLAIASRAEQIC